MKIISKLALAFVQAEDKLVHWYTSNDGYMPIDPPKRASEMVCIFCKQQSTCTWGKDGTQGAERVWFCANSDCSLSKLPKDKMATDIAATCKRAIPWPSFCEINHIGDDNHMVKFESIQQATEKIAYMRKFAESPTSIILMQGPPGVGKTYAALGMCEYFTRKHSSCSFVTQKQMAEKWAYDRHSVSGYSNCSMLVIDDFGMTDVPAGFMGYFMDMMNSRIQWKNKGTIITTNLQGSSLARICGDPLMDRFMTGQIFNFSGPSRRTKKAF